jgi:hypothetical protein
VCILGYCRTNNATLNAISYVQAVFVVLELVPLFNDRLQKKKNEKLFYWTTGLDNSGEHDYMNNEVN